VLHVSGPQARELEKISDARIAERMMDLLKKSFAESIPDPIDSFSTRWKSDAFSLGSYSVIFIKLILVSRIRYQRNQKVLFGPCKACK